MRALAASLRGDAATIAGVGADLAGEVGGMIFEGPAATEFFARMEATQKRCSDMADRLLALAGLLEVSASEVEAAQRERERKLEAMRQAELERRQEAAQGAL